MSLFSMYMTACTKQPAPLPVDCNITFPAEYTYYPATSTPSGKRVYLYYGLNSGGRGQWATAPYSDLVANLRAAGDDVILASESEPQVQACKFTNGGWQYRSQFNDAINNLMNTVELQHGTAQKNIIGGVSYGGLHAMMGAVLNGRFFAWFAHLPVTRLDALTEFAGIGNVKHFNPQYEVAALSAKKGLITWGTADTRVNFQLTENLANMLPNTVTKIAYAGQGHTTTVQNINDITNWLSSQ